MSTEALCDYISEKKDEISMVLLSFPNSFTGSTSDIKKISAACGDDVILIVDLAHGVGALEINVAEMNVTAAVLCTYKYLCAGPGNVGAIYLKDPY